jgi:hypothetical protein
MSFCPTPAKTLDNSDWSVGVLSRRQRAAHKQQRERQRACSSSPVLQARLEVFRVWSGPLPRALDAIRSCVVTYQRDEGA